ncbi:MAG: hypothetical protein JO224_05860 [Pelomonas sp.]|nr:hypothetical protein [Roseateles sp.]
MLQNWTALLAPALQDRLVLLFNHVISREAQAMARLQPFAGRAVVLRLVGWPSLLPKAPDLAMRVTPAGLWERLDDAPADALAIEVDAANPALLALGAVTGEQPRVTVQGDAAFAGAIHWLAAELRWDLEDDLAGVTGPAAAHQLASWGRAAAKALAALARQAANLRAKA